MKSKIINGDCIEEMKKMPENSVDSIITDPPYDLTTTTRPRPDQSEEGSYGKQVPFSRQQSRGGFMGKDWDGTEIAFKKETWQEALRVLKPGGYLLSFGGARTYHRMACAIEDAGFEIRDMVEWIYGSGFPKSLNIGKAVDELQGNEREDLGLHLQPGKAGKTHTRDGGAFRENIHITKGNSPYEGYGTALKPAHEPICMARKPLSEKTVAKNVLKWGTGGINIDGCRVEYNGEKPNLGGRPKHTRGEGYGFKAQGEQAEANTKGRFPANLILDGSDEVVALFPNTKSSGGQFKKNDYEEKGVATNFRRGDFIGRNDSGSAARFFYCAKASKAERNAGTNDYLIINICVENMERDTLPRRDISESIVKWLTELYGKQLMEKYQMDISSTIKTETNKTIISIILNSKIPWNIKEYTLDAIRTQMASGGSLVVNAENTNEWKQIIIEGLTEYLLGVKLVVSKTQLKISVSENNFHSTVKPVKLMEYLCTLTKTPNGGIVLDPFMGSGTTGIACINTGRDFIGIEQDKEYCKIAGARLEHAMAKQKEKLL